MKKRFRDSMNWLHTWSGLIVGWLLFAVFLTGSLAYFQNEISQWMQPELTTASSAAQAASQAQAFLQQKAPNSERWIITLPTERALTTDIFWRTENEQGRRFGRASLDGSGAEAVQRETRGGNFLYRFHFDLYHMPVLWARWLVGIASMLMLLAILTGIVIHKKIFKDFFSLQWLRGHKGWLSGHTLTTVLALPFHLMITYTGLVTLMFMYMGAAVELNYTKSQDFYDQLFGSSNSSQASGQQAPLTSLATVVTDARQQLQGADIAGLSVLYPGDKAALIEVREASTSHLISGTRVLTYSGSSGELLHSEQVSMLPEQIRRTLVNLHAGRFADMPLRWLYFLSGIMGSLMIATGLLLWSAKRLGKVQQHAGHALVNWLNAGTLLGLPLAIAAYFAANRLLPVQLEARADWEIRLFFAGWALMLAYALLRPRHIWRDGCRLLALGFFAVPVLNLFTTQRHLFYSLRHGDWVMAGFDLSCLAAAGLAFLCAHYTKIAPVSARKVQNTPAQEAAR